LSIRLYQAWGVARGEWENKVKEKKKGSRKRKLQQGKSNAPGTLGGERIGLRVSNVMRGPSITQVKTRARTIKTDLNPVFLPEGEKENRESGPGREKKRRLQKFKGTGLAEDKKIGGGKEKKAGRNQKPGKKTQQEYLEKSPMDVPKKASRSMERESPCGWGEQSVRRRGAAENNLKIGSYLGGEVVVPEGEKTRRQNKRKRRRGGVGSWPVPVGMRVARK